MRIFGGDCVMNRPINVRKVVAALAVLCAGLVSAPHASFARDLDYSNEEISIFVTPGEPTQVQFPGAVTGGVKRKVSSLSLEHKDSDLVIFASEAINENG